MNFRLALFPKDRSACHASKNEFGMLTTHSGEFMIDWRFYGRFIIDT